MQDGREEVAEKENEAGIENEDVKEGNESENRIWEANKNERAIVIETDHVVVVVVERKRVMLTEMMVEEVY